MTLTPCPAGSQKALNSRRLGAEPPRIIPGLLALSHAFDTFTHTKQRRAKKKMILRNYNDTNFLTSLRAIAILFVFLIHSGGGGLRTLGGIGNFLVDIGKYGVQIFFVISGFTIFSQFFSEKYTLKKFILVRLSRLSLPYYPILLILFVYINLGSFQFNYWARIYNNSGIELTNLMAHILYISPYNIKYQTTIIGVEWTIGIEVFYYILFGLIIHFKYFRLNNKSFFIFGVFFYLLSVFTQILQKRFHLDMLFVHWLPFRYGYMFFLGGLAYYMRRKYTETKHNVTISKKNTSDLVLVAIISLFGLLVASTLIFQVDWFIVENAFVISTFIIIVLFNDDGRISKVLNNMVFVFIGSISYSFYLIHYIIIQTLPKLNIAIIGFIVELILIIFVSFVWYYIFEKTIYARIKRQIKKM